MILSPVLCLFFFHHLKPSRDNVLVRFMKSRYLWQLKACLKYRWTTVLVMSALVVGTVFLLPFGVPRQGMSVVVCPGLVTEMTPAQLHIHFEESLRAG